MVTDAEGTILFIAECKKYDGPKVVSKGITQLFKNLVWRDRRCSLIIFNTSRRISTAIKGTREAIEAHPLFISVIEELEDDGSHYLCRMQIAKDDTMEAKMSVQVFDLSTES